MQNGHRTLDLTEFTELAHIKAGSVEFDIPFDIPLPLQMAWRRIFTQLESRKDVLTDEQTEEYEVQLWELGNKILQHVVPPIDRPAREVFVTLAALAQLMRFLAQAYSSDESSTDTSKSSTPSAAPSP